MKEYKVGYTTGVYDLFHIGHLNLLKRAKEKCDFLIVGVTTDEETFRVKNKKPIIPFEERINIVSSIRFVDYAVPESNTDKLIAWEEFKFDAIFKGDDWKGSPKWEKYEDDFSERGVDVVYFTYTEGTSSTLLSKLLHDLVDKKSL